MKVIIKDKFYEFQNQNTEDIFSGQKNYLTNLIKEHEGNSEELLTALFSLYNLSEALLDKVIEDIGENETISVLKAKAL